MSNLFSSRRNASATVANNVVAQPQGLSAAELDAEVVNALPEREEMCGGHHWCQSFTSCHSFSSCHSFDYCHYEYPPVIIEQPPIIIAYPGYPCY